MTNGSEMYRFSDCIVPEAIAALSMFIDMPPPLPAGKLIHSRELYIEIASRPCSLSLKYWYGHSEVVGEFRLIEAEVIFCGYDGKSHDVSGLSFDDLKHLLITGRRR